VVQPAVAPRFSRTKPPAPTLPRDITPDHTREALEKWFPAEQVQAWREAGVTE
jgi:hypothetical protein